MAGVLYYSPGACSLAAHILLEELGHPYSTIEVNVQKGDTRKAEFLSVNPKGRVPVLLVEGQILTEVPAICWYLGRLSDDLIPHDALGQTRVLEWFNWLSGTLHGVAFGGKWRPERFVSDSALYSHVRQRADQNLAEGFGLVNLRMAQRQWAAGSDYSIVDPYLLVFYLWASSLDSKAPELYPHWHEHALRVMSRPAAQRVLEKEGLTALASGLSGRVSS